MLIRKHKRDGVQELQLFTRESENDKWIYQQTFSRDSRCLTLYHAIDSYVRQGYLLVRQRGNKK